MPTSEPSPVNLNYLQHSERAGLLSALPPLDDEFVKEHQSMIEAIASAISGKGSLPTGIDFDDLVSWGMEGLIKAHGNFRPEKGSSFRTYAYYRIRGEMYDRIRTEWQYRNPVDYAEQRRKIQERIADVVEEVLAVSEQLNPSQVEERMAALIQESAVVCLVSLDGIEDLEGSFDPQFEAIDAQQSDLWDEVSKLDPEERQVVELFYVQGLKQKEIAEKLNQSRSRVCRVHTKVLDKLRRRLLKRKG